TCRSARPRRRPRAAPAWCRARRPTRVPAAPWWPCSRRSRLRLSPVRDGFTPDLRVRRPGGAPPSAYPQPRTGGVVLMGTRGVCNAELGVRFPPPPSPFLAAWKSLEALGGELEKVAFDRGPVCI